MSGLVFVFCLPHQSFFPMWYSPKHGVLRSATSQVEPIYNWDFSLFMCWTNSTPHRCHAFYLFIYFFFFFPLLPLGGTWTIVWILSPPCTFSAVSFANGPLHSDGVSANVDVSDSSCSLSLLSSLLALSFSEQSPLWGPWKLSLCPFNLGLLCIVGIMSNCIGQPYVA